MVRLGHQVRQCEGVTALVVEIALAALACSGAGAGYHLVHRPDWSQGTRIGDLAGVERCGGVRFPPGAELVVGYFYGVMRYGGVLVVRLPGPPDPAALGAQGGTPTSGTPAVMDPQGPKLPEPSSLGLHGPSRQGGLSVPGTEVGTFHHWDLWFYGDEERDETIVYAHWWSVP